MITIAPIPLSALNQFLFCPRRMALIHLEQEFESNHHTAEGDVVHGRVDTPGYHVLRGVKVLRCLQVWSEELGLTGICDVVEKHPDGRLVPVEFKKSRKKSFINDAVQVCAQALCLEEMFQCSIEQGALFFAASRAREDIPFDQNLRHTTLETIRKVHQLFASGQVPPAVKRKACQGCSLIHICLPDAMRLKRGVATWFENSLSLPS